MRIVNSVLATGLIAFAVSAFAGEYNNECNWGLANGKHVGTECKVNMTREDGKIYCFSNDKAMDAFMKAPSVNMNKAKETFGRS
jgi:hypothetical protein